MRMPGIYDETDLERERRREIRRRQTLEFLAMATAAAAMPVCCFVLFGLVGVADGSRDALTEAFRAVAKWICM